MYFDFFGTILYDNQILTDLSKRLTNKDVTNSAFMYDTYAIQNGERPDSISTKFYGVPYYHWVILATNNLTLKDWPKSDAVFEKYMDDKYENTRYNVNHYEDELGRTVPYKFPQKFIDQDGVTQEYYFNGDGLGVIKNGEVYNPNNPVYNQDFEVAVNDSKRNIYILDKSHLADVVDLAKRLLRK